MTSPAAQPPQPTMLTLPAMLTLAPLPPQTQAPLSQRVTRGLGVALMGLLALSLQAAQAATATKPSAKLTLKTSYGGAVLVGSITLPHSDTLINVSSSQSHSRLLKCAPLCKVVPSLAIKNVLQLSSASAYRIALGGAFKPGQKISLTLRFKSQGMVVTQATVQKP